MNITHIYDLISQMALKTGDITSYYSTNSNMHSWFLPILELSNENSFVPLLLLSPSDYSQNKSPSSIPTLFKLEYGLKLILFNFNDLTTYFCLSCYRYCS